MKRKYGLLILGCILMAAAGGCGAKEGEDIQSLGMNEMLTSTISENIPPYEFTESIEWVVEDTDKKPLSEPDMQEEITGIYYLEDEEIKDMPLYVSFLNNEIPAYDKKEQRDKFYWEYCDYDIGREEIVGVHIMAEDLNEDGEKELLINISYLFDQGILIVIHEEDGKLYQWRIYNSFFFRESSSVLLYSNGILEQCFHLTTAYIKYYDNGDFETVLVTYKHTNYTDEMGNSIYVFTLEHRKNGEMIEVFDYEMNMENSEIISGKEEVERIEREVLGDAERIRTIAPLEDVEIGLEINPEIVSLEEAFSIPEE